MERISSKKRNMPKTLTCPRCKQLVSPFRELRGRNYCPECWARLKIHHVWPEGSEEAQKEYDQLKKQAAELQRQMRELQAAVDEKIQKLEEKETVIKSKMMTIWQDNDAPQAEEITKTSLAA